MPDESSVRPPHGLLAPLHGPFGDSGINVVTDTSAQSHGSFGRSGTATGHRSSPSILPSASLTRCCCPAFALLQQPLLPGRVNIMHTTWAFPFGINARVAFVQNTHRQGFQRAPGGRQFSNRRNRHSRRQ